MRAGRIVLKFVAFGLAVIVFAFLAVRIFSHNSPTVDVLGSYFPAWMVCILSGLALTFVVHWIVQVGNLKPYIGPAPLIYSCLMIIFTFATWILFYQN
ncbi:MAG TPA: YtcA family lipoprotein [Candidatus Udaeobacter sp.]|nr:YtcA family lipoprotein [Candidatus Udaeobacter sp.]